MTNQFPELVISDNIGVCSVRDDTRALAEATARTRETPGRALDMGTGSGYVGLYLAQRGWIVDATDVSPRAVELARRNANHNGLALNIYASDLFAQVTGKFDAIAFNPPMRPTETEFSRLITALLRRNPRISGWLMRVVGRRFEHGRHAFLADVAAQARQYLNREGRLLMGISDEEASRLDALPGVHLVRSTPIPSMPRQDIYEFQFDDRATA